MMIQVLKLTGALVISAMLFLASWAMASQDEKPAEAAPPTDQPSAHDLIEKGLEAMGGRKSFEEIKSMELEATAKLPYAGGATMTTHMYTGADDKFLIRQVVPGMLEMSIGTDGKVGWVSPEPGEYVLNEKEELEELRRQTSMHLMFRTLEKDATKVETAGREEFMKRDAWKVLAEDDLESRYVYFDVENGLPLGTMQDFEGEAVTIAFKDWKEFGDVKLYTKVSSNAMGMDLEMVFETIKLNEVDPSVFELPDEVKALVKEEEAERAQDPGKTGDKDEEGAGGT